MSSLPRLYESMMGLIESDRKPAHRIIQNVATRPCAFLFIFCDLHERRGSSSAAIIMSSEHMPDTELSQPLMG